MLTLEDPEDTRAERFEPVEDVNPKIPTLLDPLTVTVVVVCEALPKMPTFEDPLTVAVNDEPVLEVEPKIPTLDEPVTVALSVEPLGAVEPKMPTSLELLTVVTVGDVTVDPNTVDVIVAPTIESRVI